jgi:hypothetical protein
MSTIQEQMKMYHALEVSLRNAADTKQPMTLGDLWDVAAIKETAPKMTHVRDKLKVLLKHKLVAKLPVAESLSGNRMSRVGYMWAQPDKTVEEEIKFRHSATLKSGSPGPVWPVIDRRMPVVTAASPSEDVEIEFNGFIVHARRGVEMYIADVKCNVDKNPETGRVRIKIV